MRRKKGTGTVGQTRDGLWVASIELPRKRGDKRKRKTFSSMERSIVVAKMETYQSEHPNPQPSLPAQKVGSHTTAEWYALLRQANWVCLYCKRKTAILPFVSQHDPLYLNKEHKIPFSRGGTDDIENIAVSCSACNLEKASMTASEYIEWRERTYGR